MKRNTIVIAILCTALTLAGAAVWSAAADIPVRTGLTERGDLRPEGEAEPAGALKRLSDCDQLRDYLAEVILDTIIQARYWGYWYGPWAGGGAEDASATDFTTTNVQEEGVDELDLVKTDGSYLYVAGTDGDFLIVDAWPPEVASLASSLPVEGYPIGIFLLGDRVLLFSWFYDSDVMPRSWYGTRIDLIDVSDRQQPEVLRSIDVEGVLAGARMIDGHVYAVLSSYLNLPEEVWELAWGEGLGLPDVDWDATEEEREAAAAVAREILRPLIDQLVAGLSLEKLLPLMWDRTSTDPIGALELLVECEDIYRPAETASYSVLSVLHLDLGAESPVTSEVEVTGLLADGFTVYASTTNLYVSQSSWWWWWGWGGLDMTTAIHRFSLDPDSSEPVQYEATGEVPGWLLNQFSMGEYEGHLRVATTLFDWWWGTDDGEDETGAVLTVLKDNGFGGLVEVGQISGIAPGERIYATRFMGPKGYLVTFEQIDPLFTLDLSDPADPQIVGELEMPGYSAYLHPIGEDYLLAVGMNGEEDGTINGLAVNLFDVSDFANPTLAHQYVIEDSESAWSWSEALSDHHAFTFHRDVLSIPAYVSQGSTRFNGLVVMSVDEADGIAELGRVDHSGMAGPEWTTRIRRSVYMDDYLYSLSSAGVKVNGLFDPSVLFAEVPFYSTGSDR